MTPLPKQALIYIADPMCSWCWGFSPVMDAICETYHHRVPIALLVGGLRPGNTERFDEQRRNSILGHWKAVHEQTGQPFNFQFRMGPGFTYDTEPASRTVVTVRAIRPDLVFPVFRDIQRAFYVDNRDVTQETVLSEIATAHGIDREQFRTRFQDPETKNQAWEEFSHCRELGISGFPSLLGKHDQAYTTFSQGYVPFETLVPQIETWLTRTPIGTSG